MMEKETAGLVIHGMKADLEASPKWTAVGMVLA